MNKKELVLLKKLAYVNCISKSNIIEVEGLSKYFIDKICKEELLKKDVYLNNNKDFEVVYTITNKGRNFVKKYSIFNAYQSKSIEHDILLSDYYFKKDIFTNRLYSEDELIIMFKSKFFLGNELHLLSAGELSPPDGAYINDEGTIIAVEAVTSCYKKSMIQAKIDFCKLMDFSLIIVRRDRDEKVL